MYGWSSKGGVGFAFVGLITSPVVSVSKTRRNCEGRVGLPWASSVILQAYAAGNGRTGSGFCKGIGAIVDVVMVGRGGLLYIWKNPFISFFFVQKKGEDRLY
jgi:hypothetical protein